MLYQLIQHNNETCNFVAQSPDLTAEDAVNTWFNMSIFGKQLPEGFQWGVIPETHPSYTKVPTVIVVGKEPSFEEIYAQQKIQWHKEEIELAEEQEHFAEYLRKYRPRK